jgi:signal transduction histidine kinase
MHIRALAPQDAPAFQALRLRGLQECPEAFASSYEEEVGTPLEEIEKRLQPKTDSAIFGALQGAELCALVGLQREGMAKLAHKSFIYVQRMQQAVRVLYGQASPSEALQAAQLELAPLDLDRFLQQVAANAQFAGIEGVRYVPQHAAVMVRADEFSLEDVMTHILRNADRHRTPRTPITLSLQADGTQATVRIHNEGPEIEAALLGRIFDYGVSEAEPEGSSGRRGQGLFVARTYMAKMGGTVSARNEAGGVAFYLVFPRG